MPICAVYFQEISRERLRNIILTIVSGLISPCSASPCLPNAAIKYSSQHRPLITKEVQKFTSVTSNRATWAHCRPPRLFLTPKATNELTSPGTRTTLLKVAARFGWHWCHHKQRSKSEQKAKTPNAAGEIRQQKHNSSRSEDSQAANERRSGPAATTGHRLNEQHSLVQRRS